MMPIVPGRFDEDAAEIGIAGFGDGAADPFRAAGVSDGTSPNEGHHATARRGSGGGPKFGGNGERGEIVDTAETAQALDTRAQRVEGERNARRSRSRVCRRADGFVDGPHVGAMGLFEGRQRPALGV